MNPEQIALLTAICQVIDKIGTWPLGVIIALTLGGPWIVSLCLNRMQERRFYAMKEMYERNVELVKQYEKNTQALEKTTHALLEMISLNTAKWAEAIEKIDTNQYCPAHRTEKIRMEDVRG